MDISAYLASVQDNPQSAMLARNVMQPGIPSPDGSNAPDAGALPQPSWSDQSQDMSQAQDTGPVTGGFDQAQISMPPLPEPDDQPQDDQSQDEGYAMGGRVGTRHYDSNTGGAPCPAEGTPPSERPPHSDDCPALDDTYYARGGMVRPPRMPRVKAPKARQPKAAAGQNGGLFSPSTRRGGPGEDPSTNLPEDAISPIGMYDKAGNLHGISDIGITKAELGQGGPQRYANAGMWGDAGPAGDSSGGLAEGGSVDELSAPAIPTPEDREKGDAKLKRQMSQGKHSQNFMTMDRRLAEKVDANVPRRAEEYAEGGSVDELPDDKIDDQYAQLPSSENVDDRRRDVITPQQYAGMSAHEQAMASNYPGGPGDDMLAGSKRTLKGPMKFDGGGEVDETLSPESAAPESVEPETTPAIPEPGESPAAPRGAREMIGDAMGMRGRKAQLDAPFGMGDTQGISQAVYAGFKDIYNKAGVNAGVPTPQVEHSAKQMFEGKGATPSDQAEAAIDANEGNSGKTVKAVYDFFNTKGGDASKDLTALHDYASDKIDPNPTPGIGRSGFEDMGAAAAAGMLQHIRTRFNQTAALATAAPDPNKKGEVASLAFDKYVPDGSKVQVVPTGNGYNVSVDGKNTPVTTQQLDHMLATPFDVIAHMGVSQTLANLQNVSELQHMSGQPQQPQAPAPQQPPAAAPPANWPGKSQGYHQEQSEAGRAQVRAGRDQGQPGVPVTAGDANAPGANDPITIVRGGGPPTRGGSAYTPTTMQRVNRETGQDIDRPPPPIDAGRARIQQEQIRQQGLNKRAEDSSSSPHGREATLKGLREKQAMTAAQAEIKEAENNNGGKPVDRAAIYKKYGLEHLTQGSQAAPAAGGTPKDGEIRVINGRKMRADVKKGGWVPAE